MNILIVEPARLYQKMLGQLLDEQGFSWTSTRTAETALLRMRSESFDMVCVAAHLEGTTTGIELAQQIRSQHSALPILMITSESDQDFLSRALRAGVTDILMKSEISLFAERLATLLPMLGSRVPLSGKVCLLEDEEAQRRAYSQVLEQLGLDVRAAATTAQARDVLEEDGIDLIICDMILDGHETGLDFIRKIRSGQKWYSTPIVAISASNDRSRRLAALAAGAQVFIEKSAVVDEFSLHVRNLMFTRQLFRKLEHERELLRQLATTDSLTGLFNRAFLIEAAGRAIPEAHRHHYPLALLLLDVDHFKEVNDSWGHARGDEVLRELGQLMKSYFRREDIPARFGGEEFVVLMGHCDRANAHAKATRLAELIRGGQPGGLPITVSMGVAVLARGEPASFDELFKLADNALYAAKQGGRDCVIIA